MSETIKQAVARCKGTIFVRLDPGYAGHPGPMLWKVSKPEARKRIIDPAPKGQKPHAVWAGEDLILMPGGVSDPA